MANPLLDFDVTFFRGAKSDSDPGQLPLGYYFTGINVINQGGVLSCRPGNRCVITFPEGNLQGAAIFRPKVGLEQMVVVVDGRVFVAEFPFVSFRQLEDLIFSDSAKQIYFEMAEQTARRLSTEQSAAIEVILPRAVLMMQDGGATAPGFYDGSESGHIRDNAFETPAGGAMKWTGDRLWVAVGSQVRASDIGNPFSFREEIYLGGNDAFNFKSDVTALEATPGTENPQLLVFTDNNAEVIKSYIRSRSSWQEEPNMQAEVFKVGCSGQRSVVSHMGQLMWYSPAGVVFLDSAVSSKTSSRLPYRDSEMLQSKAQMHSDTSLVAGAAFGNYLLMSVPSEDVYNRQTWVLNNASLETISDGSGPSWCGIWTGTRPVQWITGVIAGQERIYHISKDHDGANRLWESFTPDRLDNGCPITWAAELRGFFGPTGQAQKSVNSKCEMRYAQLGLSAIDEDIDVGVFYAGGMRGAYKRILNRTVRVARGSLDSGETITADSTLFGFKSQTRMLETEDVKSKPSDEKGSCPVESNDNENIDFNFQIMVVGHGPATFNWIRVFADPKPDTHKGDPRTACGSETDDVNVIRFDGYGAEDDSFLGAVEALSAQAVKYESNQTATVDANGLSAVGVGYAESIVSQQAADRVAKRIAERTAENELMAQLPTVVSAGIDVE